MNKSVVIENLSFQYDRHNKILTNVSLCVKYGEFVGIIGPNGSGKSTLLKLILNEINLDEGKIELLGKSLNQCDYSQVGYVAQNVGLIYQNILANVEEIICSNLVKDKKNGKERLLKVLEEVGMSAYRYHLIDQLSGGQQQRVAIAKSLISNPKILILDEPTAGIDKKTSQRLYQLLQNLTQQGITVLMVTHDLSGCASYLSKTFCVENGNVCELSKEEVAHELSHRHKHPEE